MYVYVKIRLVIGAIKRFYLRKESGICFPSPLVSRCPHHPPSRLLDCTPSSLHHYCQITCHFKGGQDVRGEILAARRRGVWARCCGALTPAQQNSCKSQPGGAAHVLAAARRWGWVIVKVGRVETWDEGRHHRHHSYLHHWWSGPSQLRPLTFREF